MIKDILGQTYFQNTVLNWFLALSVAAFAFVVVQLVRTFVANRLGRLADKTATMVDDVLVDLLKHTNILIVTIASCYFGSLMLEMSPGVSSFVKAVTVTGILVQIGLWGGGAVGFILSQVRRKKKGEDPASVSILAVLSLFVRLAVWSIVAFVIFENLGVDITALVAGMGVGGIAIALALQNILGDVFCSIAILIDKPFEVGDFLIVGQELGTVEKIGLKTTRVRSLSGEQLIFSNADLVGSRIRNYKRMEERRILSSFGVIYQTPVSQLEAIPGMIKEIIEKTKLARFDRAHFKVFGDSSLDFEFVYYVLNSDYNVYMNIQQHINLELCRCFGDAGIEFAYPTRTLYLKGQSDDRD